MLELNFKWNKKRKIISTKILITSMYCPGWFGKIVLNKAIGNKQILIDEESFGEIRFQEKVKVLVKD